MKHYKEILLDSRYHRHCDIRKIRAQVTNSIVNACNEEQLCEFLGKLNGLKTKTLDEVRKNAKYWQWVWDAFKAGNSRHAPPHHRKKYNAYWTKLLVGKLPKDDDTRLALNDYQACGDGDIDGWEKRLNALYAAGKQNDNGRIVKFLLAICSQANGHNGFRLLTVRPEYERGAELFKAYAEKLDKAKLNDNQRSQITKKLQHGASGLKNRGLEDLLK